MASSVEGPMKGLLLNDHLRPHVCHHLGNRDVVAVMLTSKALQAAFEQDLTGATLVLRSDEDDVECWLTGLFKKPNLRVLEIYDEDNHQAKLWLSPLTALQKLVLNFREYPMELLSVPTQLESLTYRTMEQSFPLDFLSGLGRLTQLIYMFQEEVNGANELLRHFGSLTQLRDLHTHHLHECLPQLLQLTNLQGIGSGHRLLPMVRELSALEGLTKLCIDITRPPGEHLPEVYYPDQAYAEIGVLTRLQSLELVNDRMTSMQPLAPLTNLRSLSLSCRGLFSDLAFSNTCYTYVDREHYEPVDPLASLTKLSHLVLENIPTWQHAQMVLSRVPWVVTLLLAPLSDVCRNECLRFLLELPALKTLALKYVAVRRYTGLLLPPRLEHLVLYRCRSLEGDLVPQRPGLTVVHVTEWWSWCKWKNMFCL